MRRGPVVAVATAIVVLWAAPQALACGGLIAPDGAVNLLRTTTLAAYADGVEHYITSFEFAGGGGRFGSITPLPGIPSKVVKGGDWTLQRLLQEVTPVAEVAFAAAGADSYSPQRRAKVLQEVSIDALDITILEGGGDAVGRWAEENGFRLSADAPEVLDFYAQRSPIFMAARFDLGEARKRGLDLGDGTPVHLQIPTPDPWVPLRILGLGKAPEESIEADVFLLTEERPALLPSPGSYPGMSLDFNGPASDLLLSDLRSDRGMRWVPEEMWLSYIRIDTTAGRLTHDLAIDATGQGTPSLRAAGFFSPGSPPSGGGSGVAWWVWFLGLGLAGLTVRVANGLVRPE